LNHRQLNRNDSSGRTFRTGLFPEDLGELFQNAFFARGDGVSAQRLTGLVTRDEDHQRIGELDTTASTRDESGMWRL